MLGYPVPSVADASPQDALAIQLQNAVLQEIRNQAPGAMRHVSLLLLTLGLVTHSNSANAQESDVARELEEYWTMVERTVVEGDHAGMVASYHPEAVTVSVSATSASVSKVMDGMIEDKAKDELIRTGVITRMIEFDVTKKIHGETAAMESGWFHYWYQEPGSEMSHTYGTMEAYFVKLDTWVIVAERINWSKTEQEWKDRHDN